MSTALCSLVDKMRRLLSLPKRCNQRSWEIPLFPCSTFIELSALSVSACCGVGKTRSRLTRKRQRADSTRENKEKVKFARCVPGLRADRVREFVDYGRTWLIADWAAPNGGCARENMWKTRNKIPPRDASFARKINLKIHRLSIPSKAKPLKRENVIPHFPLVFPPRTTSWRLLIPARCGISHVPAYSINFPTRFSSKTKPRATPISFYVLSSFFHRGMCVIWLRNLKRSWILAIVFANSTVFRV